MEKEWTQLMDSMYEEDPWWETNNIHPRINPSHFNPNDTSSTTKKSPRPTLTRTISQKFQKNAIVKETTGGLKKLTRSVCVNDKVEETARSYLYDPTVWSEAFKSANAKEKATMRKMILEGSRVAAMSEFYWVKAGKDGVLPKKVNLVTHNHTLENATMFNYEKDPEPGAALKESRYSGTAHFIYADSVDVGVFMKQEQKCDPLVLVFANPSVLGGELYGGTSQEEYILRRTNILNIVNNEVGKEIKRDWVYNLPDYGGLYVPSAMIFRSNESTGYKFLVNPIRLSFVLASAPLNTHSDKANEDVKFIQDWQKRIDSLFAMALQKGHDALVLGAWGCGELRNNCTQVARLFREALTTRFRGCFKHVVFAFLHDPDAFRMFCAEFGAPKMDVPPETEIVNRKKRRTVNVRPFGFLKSRDRQVTEAMNNLSLGNNSNNNSNNNHSSSRSRPNEVSSSSYNYKDEDDEEDVLDWKGISETNY